MVENINAYRRAQVTDSSRQSGALAIDTQIFNVPKAGTFQMYHAGKKIESAAGQNDRQPYHPRTQGRKVVSRQSGDLPKTVSPTFTGKVKISC